MANPQCETEVTGARMVTETTGLSPEATVLMEEDEATEEMEMRDEANHATVMAKFIRMVREKLNLAVKMLNPEAKNVY